MVALRKESVDRNSVSVDRLIDVCVALRKESVDRNNSPHGQKYINRGSLSARRAWIEMRLADMSAAWNRCRSPQGERG